MGIIEDRPVALVTGASSGIGAAIATRLGKAGYLVLLVARREEVLDKVATHIRDMGGQAEIFPANLADEDATSKLFLEVMDKIGRIDVLVNNAGLGWYGFCDEMQWDLARELIEVNVVALTRLTHLFLPGLKTRGRGHIINISSIAGSLPNQGIVIYSATKSFVDSFTTSLYRELRGSGVQASLVKPGAVRTDFFETAARGNGQQIPAQSLAVSPERVAKCIMQLIKKPRRVIYIPRILRFVPIVEVLFGWLIDMMGPLHLKRQPLV